MHSKLKALGSNPSTGKGGRKGGREEGRKKDWLARSYHFSIFTQVGYFLSKIFGMTSVSDFKYFSDLGIFADT
jgi:hypothetical protein